MIKVPRKHIYRLIPNILTIISSDWSITIGDCVKFWTPYVKEWTKTETRNYFKLPQHFNTVKEYIHIMQFLIIKNYFSVWIACLIKKVIIPFSRPRQATTNPIQIWVDFYVNSPSRINEQKSKNYCCIK